MACEQPVKVRLMFSKLDKMRFIGHLDLLKVFQRAMRRAGVPMAYSQGFNPHQIMSFALPLPLGMAGRGEIVDIGLARPMDEGGLVRAVNAVLPEGLKVLAARTLELREKNAAGSLCAASYRAELTGPHPDEKQWQAFLSLASVEVTAQNKRGAKTKDIRPLVEQVSVLESGAIVHMTIAAGSDENLKPQTLLEAAFNFCDTPFNPEAVSLCRTGMFKRDERGLAPLLKVTP